MGTTWVLTSAGLVTAAGDTPADLLAALSAGEPLARPSRIQAGEPGSPAARTPTDLSLRSAPIGGFDPKRYMDRKGLKDLSRTSQLACAAASRVAPAISRLPPDEVGVVLGSAWGSLQTVVQFERAACTDGPRFVDPFLFAETVANVPAGQISIFFGWSAFNMTVSSGAVSGLSAILRGMDLLFEGRAELAVVGGADELNLPLLRTLVCEGRPDLVGGEAACLLALESSDSAAARGAAPLGRIDGAIEWFTADSGHLHAAVGKTAIFLRSLLDQCRVESRDIDLLVLSGGGPGDTGDWPELRAAETVFSGAALPAVIAPERVVGQTWGASGPLGVVAALESLRSRDKRRALVLNRSETGHLAGIVVSRSGHRQNGR